MGIYLLAAFPKLDDWLPAKLMNGTALLQRVVSPEDYYAGMAAAGVIALVCMVTAVWCFDRKQL